MRRILLLFLLCHLVLRSAPATAETVCYEVLYADWSSSIIQWDYQCFETVNVQAPFLWVDPIGYWGPTWPPVNPPPLPPDPSPVPPTPVVGVTMADITNNSVAVRLEGPDNGHLHVVALSNVGEVTLYDGYRNAGEHQFSHGADTLPQGRYHAVKATWSTSVGDGTDERESSFEVKGRWRHSKYGTIYEHTCSADNSTYARLLSSPAGCHYMTVEMRRHFVPQVWTNGSGVAIDYGPLQLPWGPCYTTEGQNHFKQVSAIYGACELPVDDNAVAQGSGGGSPSHCGKWVFVVGLGMKRVADRCPACWNGGNEGQLDHFTTAALASCGLGTADVGTYQTIFMPW